MADPSPIPIPISTIVDGTWPIPTTSAMMQRAQQGLMEKTTMSCDMRGAQPSLMCQCSAACKAAQSSAHVVQTRPHNRQNHSGNMELGTFVPLVKIVVLKENPKCQCAHSLLSRVCTPIFKLLFHGQACMNHTFIVPLRTAVGA